MDSTDWLCWQLLDSAFPAGGFSHSGGLEAVWRQGLLADETGDGLTGFLGLSLRQAARSWVPMALTVHTNMDQHQEVDQVCQAFLSNHVARQASRQQGLSFLRAGLEAFGSPLLSEMDSRVRDQAIVGHYAPVFGGVCLALGLGRQRCAELVLFLELRTQLSAAVRLGVTGPMAAQRVQASLASTVAECAEVGLGTELDQIQQITPMLELAQMNQDRLYTRLFQS